MSEPKMIFSLEMLEKRIKVQEESVKQQPLIDEEMENTTFMLCPEANYLNIINSIFRKSKKN
jgi:hypothetical protein